MKVTLRKVLLLTLFVLVLTALFVVGANAATLDGNPTDDTSSAVARVGEDAYYTTFDGAFAAANALENGGTIKLLKDIGTSDAPFSVTATLTTTRPIVIDGARPDGGKYKITITSTARDMFTTTQDFTLQNVEFNATCSSAFIASSAAGTTITIKNSYVITSALGVWLDGSPALTIDGSTFVSKGNSAVTPGATSTIIINNSHVSAGAGNGIIDVNNTSPTIHLKGTTVLDIQSPVLKEFGITSSVRQSIRMRGNGNCNPIIIFYDSARVTKRDQGYIYYTGGENRLVKNIQFASNYTGAAFLSVESIVNGGQIHFYDSLQDAINHYGNVFVARDASLTNLINIRKNVTIRSATLVDAATGKALVDNTFTLTSSADKAFAIAGDVSVTFEFLKITTAGTAFVYDGTSANTALTLNHVTLTAGTEHEGKLDTNTFTKATPYVAKISHVGYTTLQAAIAAAWQNTGYNNTIYVVADFTLDLTESIAISKNIAFDGAKSDGGRYKITVTGSVVDIFKITTDNVSLSFENLIIDSRSVNTTLIYTNSLRANISLINVDAFSCGRVVYMYYPANGDLDGGSLTVTDSVLFSTNTHALQYSYVRFPTVITDSTIISRTTNAIRGNRGGRGNDMIQIIATDGKETLITIGAANCVVYTSGSGGRYQFVLTGQGTGKVVIGGGYSIIAPDGTVLSSDMVATSGFNTTLGGVGLSLNGNVSFLTTTDCFVDHNNVLAIGGNRVNGQLHIGDTFSGKPIIVMQDGYVGYLYDNLTDAFAKTQSGGGTIYLLDDVTFDQPLTISTGVTVVGNGHTITYIGTESAMTVSGDIVVTFDNISINVANGTAFTLNGASTSVTLKGVNITAKKVLDGFVEGNTFITYEKAVADAIKAQSCDYEAVAESETVTYYKAVAPIALLTGANGTSYHATLDGAIAAASAGDTVSVLFDTTLASAVTVDKGVTIDLNNKTITAAADAFTITAGTVSITNGTVNATNCAIVVTGGELTVKNGSYTGATAVYVKGGTVTVEDGEFTGNGAANAYVSGSDAVATGDAFVIETCSANAPKVNINGGTYTSTNAKAVASYAADTYTPVEEVVSGGRFMGTSAFADTLYKFSYSSGAIDEEGYTTVKETNYVSYIEREGIKYGFTSLADAVENAVAGETIVLVKNVVTNGTVVIDKNITINGDTFSYVGNFEVNAALTLSNISIHTTGSAFTLGEGAVLTLGANVVVNPADAILGGYNGQTITVSEKAIADALNAAGYVLTFDGSVYTVSPEAPVATLNGWNYATLQDAIAAANAGNGGTIVLLQDIVLSDLTNYFAISSNVTIDGGTSKYELTVNSTAKYLFVTASGFTFTLQNIVVDFQTAYSGDKQNETAIVGWSEGSNVTIANADLHSNFGCVYRWGWGSASQLLKIENSNLYAGDKAPAIWAGALRSTIQITGSKLSSAYDCVLLFANNQAFAATLTDVQIISTNAAGKGFAVDSGVSLTLTLRGNTTFTCANAGVNFNGTNSNLAFSDFTSTQIIRQNGTNFYFYNTFADALAAVVEGDSLFTYSKNIADLIMTQGYATTLDAATGRYNVVEAQASVKHDNGITIYYDGLASAIAAINATANGGTVTLLSDITLTDVNLPISKPLTIDGQGKYSIKNTNTVRKTLFDVAADFTLKNVVKVESVGTVGHVLGVVAGVVEINNTDITSAGDKAICFVAAAAGSKLIIKDSVIRNTAGDHVISIESSNVSEITLDNATVIGVARHAILVDSTFAGTFNIQNNSFVYTVGNTHKESAAIRINACANGATLNVTDSVITSGSSILRVWQGYLTINLGKGAVVSNDVNNAKVAEKLTEHGLTLTVLDSNDFYGAKINNGGTHCIIVLDQDAVLDHVIKKDVLFDEGSLANSRITFAESYVGCFAVRSADGRIYELCNTLTEALTVAASGETVILNANGTLDAPFALDKNITIDGQSKYTITAEGVAFNLSGNGAVTLKGITVDASKIVGAEALITGDDFVTYGSFAGVFAAANTMENGATIKLLTDVNLGEITASFTVSKPITIDGKGENGDKYTITATTNISDLNMFFVEANFTLQNVDVSYQNMAGKGAIVRTDNTALIININNCYLDSRTRGIVLGNVRENSKLTISNSTVIGGNCVLYLSGCAGGNVEIKNNSKILGRADVADDSGNVIYLPRCQAAFSVTVTDSIISGATNLLQIRWAGYPTIKFGKGAIVDRSWAGLSEYNITPINGHAIYTNGGSVNAKIILDENAYIRGRNADDIRFTSNTVCSDIYFGENYYGRFMTTNIAPTQRDTTRIHFYDTFAEVIQATWDVGYVMIGHKEIVIDSTIPVTQNELIYRAFIVDENGNLSTQTPVITYAGTGAAFALNGNVNVTFNGVSINAQNGAAFNMNGITAALTLNGVTINAAQYVTGFVKDNSIITYDEAQAQAIVNSGIDCAYTAITDASGATCYKLVSTVEASVTVTVNGTSTTTKYATFADAFAAAMAVTEGDVTINLLGHVTITDLATSFTVTRPVTINGANANGDNFKIIATGSVHLFERGDIDFTLQYVTINYDSPNGTAIIYSKAGGHLTFTNAALTAKYNVLRFTGRTNTAATGEYVKLTNTTLLSTNGQTIFMNGDTQSDFAYILEGSSIISNADHAMNLEYPNMHIILKNGSKIQSTTTAIRIGKKWTAIHFHLYDTSGIIASNNLAVGWSNTLHAGRTTLDFSEDYTGKVALFQANPNADYTNNQGIRFFDTLEAALAAYPNAYIKLGGNVEIGTTVAINGTPVIDSAVVDSNNDGVINHATITYTGEDSALSVGGTVIMTNVSFNTPNGSAITANDNAVVTVNNTTISAGGSAFTANGNAVVTVNNATISAGGSAFTVNGNAIVTVNDVTITAGTAIAANSNAVVTVNDVTITAGTAITANDNAAVNVNAATVTTNGTAFVMNGTAASITLKGVNVTADKMLEGFVEGNTFITYEEAVAKAILAESTYLYTTLTDADGITYYSAVFAVARVTHTENGVTTMTAYLTIDEALRHAKDGDVVTLFCDVVVRSTITKAITIRGNFTLTSAALRAFEVNTTLELDIAKLIANIAFVLNSKDAVLTLNNTLVESYSDILVGFTNTQTVTTESTELVNALLTIDPYGFHENNGVYTLYIATAKVVSANGISKYESLQDAIAAANDGDIVVLLMDIVLDAPIELSKSVTIQSAYTITASDVALIVNAGTTKLMGGLYRATNSTSVLVVNGGTLNVYSGYFYTENADNVINVVSGTANLYGGIFELVDAKAKANDAVVTVASGAALNVFGGTYFAPNTAGGVFSAELAENVTLGAYVVQGARAILAATEGDSILYPTNVNKASTNAPVQIGGAQIRLNLSDKGGIRFSATISKETVEYVMGMADADSASCGMLIVALDDLAQAYGFTVDALEAAGVDYMDYVANDNVILDAQGNATIRTDLGDLSEKYYSRVFAAITYVRYTVNGDEVYLYSAFDAADNARSLKQLAGSALADLSEIKTFSHRFPVTVGEQTLYSRYTDAQRAMLTKFNLCEYTETIITPAQPFENGLKEVTCTACGTHYFEIIPMTDPEGLKAVAEAKIGENHYLTLAQALAAAKDGDVITLLKDLFLDSTLVVGGNAETLTLSTVNEAKTVTIDGMGFGIYSTADAVFTVANDTTLVTLNLTVENEQGVAFALDKTAGLTLGDATVINATKIVNKISTSNTVMTAVEALQNQFVAEGYRVAENGAILPFAAQIGENKYSTFEEALAAAQTGDTLVLVNDLDLGETALILDKGITLNGNGNTVIYNGEGAAIIVNANGVTLANIDIEADYGVSVNATSDAPITLTTSGEATYTYYLTAEAYANTTFVCEQNKVAYYYADANGNVLLVPCVDLETAIANAEEGATIAVLSDVTINSSIAISKTLTIDGTANRNAIKLTSTGNMFNMSDNTTFTLKNVKATLISSDGHTAQERYIVRCAVNTHLTVENCYIESDNGGFVGFRNSAGTITINDSTIIAKTRAAVEMYRSNISTTISNTTLTSAYQWGVLFVRGYRDNWSNETSAFHLNGGTVIDTTLMAALYQDGNGQPLYTATPYAIYAGQQQPVNVTLSGNVSVVGGYFSLHVEAVPVFAENYKGSIVLQSENNYYFFTTLQDAIANAADGSTIMMFADAEIKDLTATIAIDKNLTINGNGHKITANGNVDLFTVSAGLVLNDLSISYTADASCWTLREVGDSASIEFSCTNTIRRASADGKAYRFYDDLAVAVADATDGDILYVGGEVEYSTTAVVNKNLTILGENNALIKFTGDVAFLVSANLTIKDVTIYARRESLFAENGGVAFKFAVADDATEKVTITLENSYARAITMLDGFVEEKTGFITDSSDVAVAIRDQGNLFYNVVEGANGTTFVITSIANYVAQVGENLYFSFEEAFEAAKATGETLYLLADTYLIKLSKTLLVDAPVTIDGNGFKLLADGNANLFTLRNSNFTLKNIYVEYNATSNSYNLIYGAAFTANLLVSNTELIAEHRVILLDNTKASANVTFNNNSVIVSRQTTSVYLAGGEVFTMTIEDTLISSGANFALQADNADPILHLKGGARLVTSAKILDEISKYGITTMPGNATTIYINGYTPYVNIIFYEDAFVDSEGVDIHWTGSKPGYYFYFAEDYTGRIATWENNGGAERLYFHDTFESALTSGMTIELGKSVSLDSTFAFTYNCKLYGTRVIDTNGDRVVTYPTITYTGTGSVFEVGNRVIDIRNLYIKAENGAAFTFNGTTSNLTLRGVTVTAGKVLDGLAEGNTFITYDLAVANAVLANAYVYEKQTDANGTTCYKVILPAASVTTADGTTYYKTLAEAIAAASNGDTVTLLDDVTIDSTINKALIINGQGYTLHSTAAVAFAIPEDLTLTLNDVNMISDGTAFRVSTDSKIELRGTTLSASVVLGDGFDNVNNGNSFTTDNYNIAVGIVALPNYFMTEADGIYTITFNGETPDPICDVVIGEDTHNYSSFEEALAAALEAAAQERPVTLILRGKVALGTNGITISKAITIKSANADAAFTYAGTGAAITVTADGVVFENVVVYTTSGDALLINTTGNVTVKDSSLVALSGSEISIAATNTATVTLTGTTVSKVYFASGSYENTTVSIDTAVAVIYSADASGNVTWSVYATLEDAITAANAGDVIYLINNVDLGAETLAITKDLDIRGNGHTITSTAANVFQISDKILLTLTNATVTAANSTVFAMGEFSKVDLGAGVAFNATAILGGMTHAQSVSTVDAAMASTLEAQLGSEYKMAQDKNGVYRLAIAKVGDRYFTSVDDLFEAGVVSDVTTNINLKENDVIYLLNDIYFEQLIQYRSYIVNLTINGTRPDGGNYRIVIDSDLSGSFLSADSRKTTFRNIDFIRTSKANTGYVLTLTGQSDFNIINCNITTGGSGIYFYYTRNKTVIENSTITAGVGHAIYHWNSYNHTVEIRNSTIISGEGSSVIRTNNDRSRNGWYVIVDSTIISTHPTARGLWISGNPNIGVTIDGNTEFVCNGPAVDFNTSNANCTKAIVFGENYSGQPIRIKRGDVAYCFYNTLAQAVAAAKDGDTITLFENIELDATITIDKNLTIDGQGKYTITSTADKAFALVGNVTVTFTNVNVTADGTAFVYDGVSAGTAVYLRSTILLSEKDTEGMIDGNIFDNDTVIAARIGNQAYGSLANALANAVDGDTIVLLLDATLDKSLLVDKNVTIDGRGLYTVTANLLAAFYISDSGKLALNNITVVGTVLNGVIDGFTTNNEALANHLRDNEGCEIVNESDDGIYTVSKYIVRIGETKYASFKKAIDAANAASEAVTITLLNDVVLGTTEHPLADTYCFSITNANNITIDGAKASTFSLRSTVSTNYKITALYATDALVKLFDITKPFTLQNVDVDVMNDGRVSIVYNYGSGTTITVTNCNLTSNSRAFTLLKNNTTLNITNSTVVGGNMVLYLYNSNANVTLDGSTIVSKGNIADDNTATIYVNPYSNAPRPALTVTNSVISGSQYLIYTVGGGTNGTFTLTLNEGAVIDKNWAGLAEYGITAADGSAITSACGSKLVINLNASACVNGLNAPAIVGTNETANYTITIAEGFNGKTAMFTPQGLAGTGSFEVNFYDTLAQAIENAPEGSVITLYKDVVLDAPVTLNKNLTINGQNKYNITADLEKAFNLSGNVAVTFSNTNINVTGTAFTYDGTSANTSVKLEGVILTAGKATDNTVDGNSFTNDTIAIVAGWGYSNLQSAIDAAPADGTLELIANVTLTGTVNIGKKITIDAKGFTITANDFAIFLMSDSGNLTLNNITTVVGTVLSGTIDNNVFTNSAELAMYLRDIENYAIVEANGIYTVTGKAVAKIGDEKYNSLKAAIDAANAAGGNVTITLVSDIILETLQGFKFNQNVTINGAKANGGNYVITATVTGTSNDAEYLFNVNEKTITFQNVTLNVSGSNKYAFIFGGNGTLNINDSALTSSKIAIRFGKGALNITNSSVLSTGDYAIKTFGGAPTITITSSDITSEASDAIYVNNQTTQLIITGTASDKSTIVAKRYALSFDRGTNMTISNAEIASANTPIYVHTNALTVNFTFNAGTVIDRTSTLLNRISQDLTATDGPAIHCNNNGSTYNITLNGDAKLKGKNDSGIVIKIEANRAHNITIGADYTPNTVIAANQASISGTGACNIYFYDTLDAALANKATAPYIFTYNKTLAEQIQTSSHAIVAVTEANGAIRYDIVEAKATLASGDTTTLYASLQDAITAANAGNGGTITLLANATYESSGAVTFAHDTVIDGQSKYTITASITGDFYQPSANKSLTVKNLTLRTTTVEGKSGMNALYAGGLEGATIIVENCTVESTNDRTIQVSKGAGGKVVIKKSVIIGGGEYAIYFKNTPYSLEITESTIVDSRCAIFLNGGSNITAYMENITVISSSVREKDAYAALYVAGQTNITLAGNTVIDNTRIGEFYPDAGYTGSDYGININNDNAVLTLTGNVTLTGIKAGLKMSAGNVIFGTDEAPYTGTGALAYDSAAKTYQLYATLPDAITAMNNSASGGTITMLSNYDYGTTGLVSFTKNITIDGQGKYNITADITTDFYRPAAGISLTFKNLTLTTTGNKDRINAIYANSVDATITVENCTIESTNKRAIQITGGSNAGKLIIKGSTIKGGGDYAVIFRNSAYNLEITDSTLIGAKSAINVYDGSSVPTVTISGSTLTSSANPVLWIEKPANITLKQGTVIDGSLYGTFYEGATGSATDVALCADASLTLEGNAIVKGNMTAPDGAIICGTADAPYTGAGTLVKDSSTNIYKFYATLPDAITALNNSASGGTITMLSNYDYGLVTSYTNLTKNITIDGQNKFKISAKTTTCIWYIYNDGVVFTLQNLDLTVTEVNNDGNPSTHNTGIIFLYITIGSVVNIENCTITSANGTALRAYKRSSGGYVINDSTVFGGTYGIYYDDSDHALTITDSYIYGGMYSVATNSGSSMDATITDSTLSSGILLTGTAWVVLAGDTIVDNTLIATLYPNAGYTGSEYAAHLTSASNSLTVTGNAKIKGIVKVDAGVVNFNESKQIIRQNGNVYSFFDTVDAAFATALQDGEIVFSYNAEFANGIAGYDVTQHPNGYYEIKKAASAAA